MAAASGSRTVAVMTAAHHHHPCSREQLTELLSRLRRVDAARHTLTALMTTHTTSDVMLADAVQALEHDLALALREAESARERIAR